MQWGESSVYWWRHWAQGRQTRTPRSIVSLGCAVDRFSLRLAAHSRHAAATIADIGTSMMWPSIQIRTHDISPVVAVVVRSVDLACSR